jgi:MFS transporter, DHA1 family, inner membrane transport protein
MTSTERTPYTLVLVLWLAGLCAAGQFAKISLIFPELQAIYPGYGMATGFLVTLISFVGVAFGLFAGMIVTQFGFRKPLLLSLLLGATLSALQATLPPFPVMLGSRLLEGISHLTIVVAAPTLLARLATNRDRPFVMTLWGTFFGVAFALFGFFGVPLAKQYGLPLLFIAHAVAMIMVCCALFLMLPRSEVSASAGERLTVSRLIKRHAECYRSPSISAPALGWLFYTLSFVSMLTVLPGLLPTGERLLAATLMSLAGIGVSVTFGIWLLNRITAVQIVKLGFTLSAVCVALMGLFPSQAWPAITLFAILGLVQGASFAAIPQLNPDDRSQAYANGAMAQMGNLGNLTGTVILLWMLDRFGQTGMILFGLACYGSGFAAHAWAERRRALTHVAPH